jgi:hypothetical protein
LDGFSPSDADLIEEGLWEALTRTAEKLIPIMNREDKNRRAPRLEKPSGLFGNVRQSLRERSSDHNSRAFREVFVKKGVDKVIASEVCGPGMLSRAAVIR